MVWFNPKRIDQILQVNQKSIIELDLEIVSRKKKI